MSDQPITVQPPVNSVTLRLGNDDVLIITGGDIAYNFNFPPFKYTMLRALLQAAIAEIEAIERSP